MSSHHLRNLSLRAKLPLLFLLVSSPPLALASYVATAQGASISLVAGMALLCAAGTFVIGVIAARNILKPIHEAVEVLSHVGQGDLTRRLQMDRQDELGEMATHLNQALDGVSDTMAQFLRGMEELDRGSNQISGSSTQLSSTSSESAVSLEEISTSLEQISGVASQNEDKSAEANMLAADAARSAENGVSEMEEMNSAMEAIQGSSAEISKIIKVIDEIAFQTNLLALNAAVEAARAGDAGRGFAIVAEEVRSLAMRSAEAAQDTTVKIEAATSRAQNGGQIAERVASSLSEIVEATRGVDGILDDIAHASRQQSQGLAQVREGMTALDQVTQDNAANAEELAATAEESASQTSSLRELTKRFRFTDEEEEVLKKPILKTPVAPAPILPSTESEFLLEGDASNLSSSEELKGF